MLTFALQLLKTAGKGWVEDCKKRFSPPDLRTSALYKLGLMHRDTINVMKQNGFGMARDLQLSTGNWGFELSDVPPGYHGPLHIWQGGEDLCVSLLAATHTEAHGWQDTDLVQLHELPGEGHLSFSATMDRRAFSFVRLDASAELGLPLTLKSGKNQPSSSTMP